MFLVSGQGRIGPGRALASTSNQAAPRSRAGRLAPPIPGSYAALGASETYGVGAVPRTRGYAFLLSHLLNAQRFADEGIPGTTLRAGCQTELAGALAIRPALATVFFGFNDLSSGISRASFLRDLYRLVETLRVARTKVLIIGLPDLSLLPSVRRTHIPGVRAIVADWNAGMAKVARRTGARFLDLSDYSAELASHPQYVSPDGLHPSNAGHAALARAIVATVRKDHLS